MLRIENSEVNGFKAAIRGMRNPMNSWNKSDSCFCPDEPSCEGSCKFFIGNNDLDLMKRLATNGAVHAKYRRMIIATCDITAPLYWWKEFDTYKVGTVVNSCSTMHKIHAKPFELDDFSHEHLSVHNLGVLKDIIGGLNFERNIYIRGWHGVPGDDARDVEPRDKLYWWQMIQLLPSSYNQRRTVLLNYEVLHNIYVWRKGHKLDEWHTFCNWILELPYSELITGEEREK